MSKSYSNEHCCVIDDWNANGWPPQCKPVGDDGARCD
jgi:hypothetical protein